jgi:uncharacterized protein YbgA (DUF1722 family)/uncharacterized protein YbbK (DUF523 family)
MNATTETENPIAVGISTCLLGDKVRWDGGHKRSRYITDVLGVYFRFEPVCPEFEVGMGIPREPVHLEGDLDDPRMVGNKSGEDWTARMNRYAAGRVAQLAELDLCGYLLKKDSPSCGMERVSVKNAKGMPDRRGRGLFARALMARLPLLPVEEEGRLHDARLRENFIVRVFAYHRLRQVFAGRFSRGRVVAFHSREKLLLMAHSPRHYKELGRLVAAVKDHRPADFRTRYSELYMAALAVKTTVKKNVNVLQHMLGYLRDDLGPAQKQDILQVLDDYRNGLVPLIVPLTLMRHHLTVHGIDYLNDQVYLHPHPKELALRNHV